MGQSARSCTQTTIYGRADSHHADSADIEVSDMSEPCSSDDDQHASETRRAALGRMGRYAAYTAPVMTALLIADRVAAATSGVKAGGGKGKGKDKARKLPAPGNGRP
jgi:hypothetical protein